MEDYELLAVGIEFERAAVEALFTAVPVPRHAGGKDPFHDWESATRHVDDLVDRDGPLPRRKDGKPNIARAVGLLTEWFAKHDPPAPKERSIRRWIGKNPRPWWGPN